MGLRSSLQNARYFFKWLGQAIHTWFTPYHSDDEEEEEEAKEVAEAAASDNTPDHSPKPSPPPEETTESTYSTDYQAETASVSTETATAKLSLAEVMAFRGSMSKQALAAVLGEEENQVGVEVERLVENGTAEDLGNGRYFLISNERRQILRSDSRVTEWLSRFQNESLENETLDVLDELFRQLPIKITVGRSLILHVRQKMWMIWQSQPDTCRVRMFSWPTPEQWQRLCHVDRGARRFHSRGGGGGGRQSSVTLRWRAGADVYSLESVLVEIGRDFMEQTRRRPRKDRKPSALPPTPDGAPQDFDATPQNE
jgi:hypothetical protein